MQEQPAWSINYLINLNESFFVTVPNLAILTLYFNFWCYWCCCRCFCCCLLLRHTLVQLNINSHRIAKVQNAVVLCAICHFAQWFVAAKRYFDSLTVMRTVMLRLKAILHRCCCCQQPCSGDAYACSASAAN